MQEFENGPPTSSLMSETEAQDVLRLHLTRTGGEGQISTADVAEAIHLPEGQVQGLLSEIRRQKEMAATEQPLSRRKKRDIAFACAAALVILAGGFTLARHTNITKNDPWMYRPATYSVQAGTFHSDYKTHVSPVDAQQSDLENVIWRDVDAKVWPAESGQNLNPAETIKELKARNWDAPGITHVPISLSTGPESFSSTLPYYLGRDQTVNQMCAQERHDRIEELLHEIAEKARLSAP